MDRLCECTLAFNEESEIGDDVIASFPAPVFGA
jgi:hypothetical protein